MPKTLEVFGVEYSNATGIKAKDNNGAVQTYIQPEGTKSITENGTTDVTNYASVNVNVSGGGSTINNQDKTVSPTESQQSVTADSGYTGLGTVTVEAIASDYVGSNVSRRSSSDIIGRWSDSAFEAVVPKGFYSTQTVKSYSCKTPSNPSISIDSNGLMTSSLSLEQGHYLEQTVTATEQLPTRSASSITPSESSQIAVNAGKYTTGAVTVNAIPSTYVGSGITRRSSSDLTVSGREVTAPSGYYANSVTGVIPYGTEGSPTATKGTVSNHSISVTPQVINTEGYIEGGTLAGTAVTVSASELVSGTKTVTTTGTSDVTNYASVNVDISFSTIYTGTTDPSSSLGVNGDIYLKVVG